MSLLLFNNENEVEVCPVYQSEQIREQPKTRAHPRSCDLEAEQSYSVDGIVFSVRSRGWQDRREVVDPQREEKEETQKVAPDIHSLI